MIKTHVKDFINEHRIQIETMSLGKRFEFCERGLAEYNYGMYDLTRTLMPYGIVPKNIIGNIFGFIVCIIHIIVVANMEDRDNIWLMTCVSFFNILVFKFANDIMMSLKDIPCRIN